MRPRPLARITRVLHVVQDDANLPIGEADQTTHDPGSSAKLTVRFHDSPYAAQVTIALRCCRLGVGVAFTTICPSAPPRSVSTPPEYCSRSRPRAAAETTDCGAPPPRRG